MKSKERNQIIFFMLLLALFPISGFTQSSTFKSNSVFIEAGGAALVHSINYERVILKNFNQKIGLIAGIGFSPTVSLLQEFEFDPLIPTRLKFFSQQKNVVLEVGIALTPYIENPENAGDFFKEAELAIFGEFGFKFLLFRQKYFFSIAFTPILNEIDTPDLDRIGPMPWAALRVGHRF